MGILNERGLAYLWDKIKVLVDNGGESIVESISLYRRNILFTETTRSTISITSPTNEDYSYMNGACTDGTYIVVAYSDGIYSTTDKVKLVKYDSNFDVIAEAMIDNDHANGMCYYKGKIYATSRDNSITIIDFDSLTLVNSIPMSHEVTWIDVYEDKFYTGTNYNIVIYDNTFSTQLDSIATNFNDYVKGSLYLNGGFIYKGYIYYLVGNNSIIIGTNFAGSLYLLA